MAKDLTTSQLDRQNILNNGLAVHEIQKQTGFQGILFEGRIRFTKSMVATYFDVDIRTVERYVSENSDEICGNGYEILKGKRLKEFMNCVIEQDVPDINVGNISSRTPQIALFDFKAFLNMAMLLVESENANIPSTGPHKSVGMPQYTIKMSELTEEDLENAGDYIAYVSRQQSMAVPHI